MGSRRWGDEDHPEEDPFDGLVLDDDFVRAAPVREPAAAEREREARQANLSRLLADESRVRDNREYERRRYAPGDDEFVDDDGAGHGYRRRGRVVRAIALVVLVAMVLVYVAADYFRSGGATSDSMPVPGDRSAVATAEAPVADRDAPPEDPGTEPPAGSVEAPTALRGDEVDLVRPEGWPPLDELRSDEPLGSPAPGPASGGPHSFAMMQSDGVTPVGYDPCRPVTYVVRGAGPAGAEQVVSEAVQQVAQATGLRFVDGGTTDEPPTKERESYQPERYGERWAPVLIAWSNAEESPDLGEIPEQSQTMDVAGYASSQSMGLELTNPSTGESKRIGQVFVTGSVVLDEPDLARMLEGPDGYARVRAVVAHELAHLVGLGHVDDPAQLMHPTSRPTVTSFGPGDLEGLARLGTLACFPEI